MQNSVASFAFLLGALAISGCSSEDGTTNVTTTTAGSGGTSGNTGTFSGGTAGSGGALTMGGSGIGGTTGLGGTAVTEGGGSSGEGGLGQGGSSSGQGGLGQGGSTIGQGGAAGLGGSITGLGGTGQGGEITGQGGEITGQGGEITGQGGAGDGGNPAVGGAAGGGGSNIAFSPAIYVSTSGNDSGDGSKSNPYRTIAKAASIAIAGDFVLVAGGTYAEQGISPANSGSPGSMITFMVEPDTGEVTIQHPAGSYSAGLPPVFNLSARNYIWIEGYTFSGFRYGMASISIGSGSHNVVINNRFEELGNADIEAWNENSVVWVTGTHNVVRNNYFDSITGDGISVNGQAAEYNLVSENTFVNFLGKYRSWGGEYLFSRAIDVQDMTTGNNVVAFNAARDVINHVWLDRDGSYNVMLRNLTNDSGGAIFNESRCANNVVQENIGDNCTSGIMSAEYETTGDTFDPRYINNVMVNCGRGLHINKSHRDEVRNNIIYNNDTNLYFTSLAAGQGPHIFRNNLWYSDGNANSINFSCSNVSVSSFQSSIGETNGMSANPQLNSDYTLPDGSPAKGAGDNGKDLGAFSVYPDRGFGWDDSLSLTQARVEFGASITEGSRGQSVTLTVELFPAVDQSVQVDIVPVAGDAEQGVAFDLSESSVTFAPGETFKDVTVSLNGQFEHDQLVAFRLENCSNCQPGGRNLQLVRIGQ